MPSHLEVVEHAAAAMEVPAHGQTDYRSAARSPNN